MRCSIVHPTAISGTEMKYKVPKLLPDLHSSNTSSRGSNVQAEHAVDPRDQQYQNAEHEDASHIARARRLVGKLPLLNLQQSV